MVRAGSQLDAVFEDTSELVTVREMVGKLVLATLGNESAVDLEVSLGCVVVHITFKSECLSFDELAHGLMMEGAQLTLNLDPQIHTSFLASERLQGAHIMRVYAHHFLSNFKAVCGIA